MQTIDQKLVSLRGMKVTKLRKNMLKLVSWDRGIRVYDIEGLNACITKYTNPSYQGHDFLGNLEKFTLIN